MFYVWLVPSASEYAIVNPVADGEIVVRVGVLLSTPDNQSTDYTATAEHGCSGYLSARYLAALVQDSRLDSIRRS